METTIKQGKKLNLIGTRKSQQYGKIKIFINYIKIK
jgi:hypothetical protein